MKLTPSSATRALGPLLLALSPATLWAQPADGSRFAIEEVVVTAQKRAQSVQDVGIAISVLDSSDLDRYGVTNVQDLALTVPNTQVNYNFGAVLFNVRGIGTEQYSVNMDSPVALHVDEVYLSKPFMAGLLLFDIERVEALKGPQGTLFGRNATGGAVNFYSRRPTRELSVGGTISYDDYETVNAEAYVSGPLTDRLSARISGLYVHQNEGYFYNATRDETEGRDRKHAIRGQLLWEGDDTEALLTVNWGRDRSISAPSHTWGLYTPESLAAGAPVLCPEYLNGTVNGATANCVRGVDGDYPRSDDPYLSRGGTPNPMRNRAWGATLRVEHDLGWADLTSISSYQQYLRNEQHDAEGGPIDTIEIYNNNKIKQFTQELRLVGEVGNTWNYVLGAFYEHDEYSANNTMSIAGGENILYTDYKQKLDSISVYAHNEVALTDNLDLIAGVRYTRDRVRIDGGTFFGTGLAGDRVKRPATILAPLAVSDLVENGGRRTDEDVSFKTGFQWHPDIGGAFDDAMVYAHISTGFRSGAFNAEFTETQESFTSLSPEKLTAYEAGFKSSLAGRRVQFNASIFRYDFRDMFLQANLPNSVQAVVLNAGEIKSWGGEIDIMWLAAPGLTLTLNGGYLDAEITSDVTVANQNLKGNRPVNSPKWTFSPAANYEIPLTADLNLDLAANASFRSAQYMSSANKPSNLQSSYWVVNAQVGLSHADDRWRVAVWVRNLTKTEYRTFVNDVPGYGVLNLYGRPRVFGATLGFNF